MTVAMIRSLQSERIVCFAPLGLFLELLDWSWKAAAKAAKVIEMLLSARPNGVPGQEPVLRYGSKASPFARRSETGGQRGRTVNVRGEARI
jgi:hypothetical protein